MVRSAARSRRALHFDAWAPGRLARLARRTALCWTKCSSRAIDAMRDRSMSGGGGRRSASSDDSPGPVVRPGAIGADRDTRGSDKPGWIHQRPRRCCVRARMRSYAAGCRDGGRLPTLYECRGGEPTSSSVRTSPTRSRRTSSPSWSGRLTSRLCARREAVRRWSRLGTLHTRRTSPSATAAGAPSSRRIRIHHACGDSGVGMRSSRDLGRSHSFRSDAQGVDRDRTLSA